MSPKFLGQQCNVLYKRINAILLTIFFACSAYAIHILTIKGWGLNEFLNGYYFTHMLIPPFFGNICHGLSVYSLGYFLKEKQFDKRLFIVSVLVFLLKFLIPAEIDFRANQYFGANYMLAVIYGMSGCIVINNVFRKIANRKIPIVSYIGSNSMIYYLVHFPVMFTTISLFGVPFEFLDFWVRFATLSLIVTLFLVLADYIFRVNYKIRFLFGA